MNKSKTRGSSKAYFLSHLFKEEVLSPEMKIIDMGSGTSSSWLEVFEKHPNLNYTAIEPLKKSFDIGYKSLGGFPNTKFYNEFAYEKIDGFGNFDICISLSVLEHVKQLEKMLKKSVESIKPGSKVIHWYDLGHALHPSSLKERFQIFLGNKLPFLLGEHKFVCYLDPQRVKNILERNGIENVKISYHQSPNIKQCLKIAETNKDYDSIAELNKWEYDNQEIISKIPKKELEKNYPSILITGIKKR